MPLNPITLKSFTAAIETNEKQRVEDNQRVKLNENKDGSVLAKTQSKERLKKLASFAPMVISQN